MYIDRGYIYQSVWTKDGPRRVYLGRGPGAALAASMDAEQRRQREAEAAMHRWQMEQDCTALGQLDAEYRRLRTLVHAALLAGGYRQHKRQWYRVMVAGDDMTTAIATAVPTEAELRALVDRCNVKKPSAKDLAALRAYLADNKDSELCTLSAPAVMSSIITAQGVGPAQEIVIGAEVQRMRETLGYDDAPSIERGLIDHILTCWLRMQFAEIMLTSKTSGSHTPQAGMYWERRIDQAQKRYLRALGTLAKLRQLLPGNVQVNIAHTQQVNNTIGE